ncbi:MAG: hypothetical protein ACI3VN_09400 [Candidatus Onthomonas sp.]
MKKQLSKLTSRKLWAAVAGIILGAALALGVDGDTITTVSGAITALCSVVTYISTEGRIDAAAAGQAAGAIQQAVDALWEEED